jgi:two-component system OmpR family sensor kinase
MPDRRRLTLRARLLLGLVALAAVGMVAASLVTYAQLRSFLVDRVDQQLDSAQVPVGRDVGFLDSPRDRPLPPRAQVPPGTYGELRAANSTVLRAVTYDYSDDTATAKPELPGRLPTRRSLFTVGHGDAQFRVLSEPIGQVTLVVAVPLSDVRSTLHRLVRVELGVTLLVLAGMAAMAWWLVRRELHPLEEMSTTAGAIAAGDLSQRVARADDVTEVGRLGTSLNTMLQQIEEAFAARQATEQQLRRFVADVSHELRTPLTSIRGYAELFRRGAASRPEDLATTMRRIEDEAQRMGVLVEDLLLLARLDEGRPLGREPVDLAALAEDIAGDARVAQPDRAVTVLGADQPAVVPGDDHRLRQAVANLVFNALQHTPAGSPVEVRLVRRPADVVVEVVDHGEGLTMEDAPHVFERFWRPDASRTRQSGGGAGLGLSIVASVAAAHGGSAEVGPTPGGGATFRLLLPLS